MVEPCEADLGDRSGSASNDEAGIARQGHEEIPGIAHAAGDQDGTGPVGQIDVRGGNDADDFASRSEGSFGCDTRCRAAATADECEAESGNEFSRGSRKVIGLRARFGAAEHADLATT